MSGCSDTFPNCEGFHADNRGFSLIELVVVMGIFLTVMLITSSAFKLIANSSSQQSKSAETLIEGIVGLEVLRADLQQAGFGLPWAFQNPIAASAYVESVMGANMPQSSFWPVGDPSLNFNDASTGVPRPIQSASTNFNSGSKYIVIKSTAAATNDTAKKWTTVSFVGGAKVPPRVWGDSSRDLAATDRVIVVKNNLITTPPTRQLMVTASTGNYYTLFNNHSTLMTSHVDGDTYQVYGVAPGNLSMPFNRADYYIMTPTTMPQGCAPHTGVLYKANISHSGGGYAPLGGIPLVDCVADMQIVYGLDTDNGGRVNLHTTTAPASASGQRAQIKELRVYILVQEGKKDIFFHYPSPTIDVGESFDGGATVSGRTFNLPTIIGAGWDSYRWKVYTIVVRPLNLIQ
jgi:prepilin-type N-terminal cleavage/methylation domain-containing protein